MGHKCVIKERLTRGTGSFWGRGVVFQSSESTCDIYTIFFRFFFNFQQSGRQAPVGGMNGKNSLVFCDIVKESKAKETKRRVKPGVKFKFLIK
jgi:hypothetical protein